MTFSEQVYSLCSKVPKGKVTTYKEIASALNSKGFQAIGQILRCNPYAPKVPCHRVVKTDGSLGGFKGKTEGKVIREKVSLLNSEGVEVINSKVDLDKYLFRFDNVP